MQLIATIVFAFTGHFDGNIRQILKNCVSNYNKLKIVGKRFEETIKDWFDYLEA